MCCLTTAIRSEKCVVRRFRRRANVHLYNIYGVDSGTSVTVFYGVDSGTRVRVFYGVHSGTRVRVFYGVDSGTRSQYFPSLIAELIAVVTTHHISLQGTVVNFLKIFVDLGIIKQLRVLRRLCSW